MNREELKNKIIEAKKETGTVILAHTYQEPDIIDVADITGDSFFLSKKAKEINAELLVVGLPRNMDGSEGESASNARSFASELSELTGLETVLWDERCTTVTAHGYLNDTKTRGKKRKAVIDAVAATVILQSYLDSRR